MEALGLKTAVERLPQRTRHVLVRRYGLDDRKRATLRGSRQGARHLRERVRQIQLEAESFLRTRENRRMLREVGWHELAVIAPADGARAARRGGGRLLIRG